MCMILCLFIYCCVAIKQVFLVETKSVELLKKLIILNMNYGLEKKNLDCGLFQSNDRTS